MDQLIAFKRYNSVVLFLLFLYPATLYAQLTANFSLDRTGGCAPLSVSLNNQTIGASATAIYRWDFGNGNTSSLQSPGAVYLDEKTYIVSLTVTDGAFTSSKTATVAVYKKPTVDFISTSPKICLPSPALFTSNSKAGDGSISSYFWDFGDGAAQQGYGTGATHYYSYEQKPTVSLTVTNSYGCYNSLTKSGIIEILGSINPLFSADKTILCTLSDAVKFTNNSTGPGTLLYKWDFGDGTTSTAKEPLHNFTKKGVYPVTLTVSNTDGCSVTSYPVSINAAYFNTDFTSRPLCREVSFNSTSFMYPSNSLWKYGDGTADGSYSSATHIYNTAGLYNVSLINTYGLCKDTVSKTVQVEELVNFNTSVETPALLCKANYYTFKNKSTVTPGSSFWEFGDATFSSWGTDVSHSYVNSGAYTIKLTNTFGTCKEVVTKDIVVNDLPNLKGFVVDYGGVCGSPVTLKFKDTTPGTVKWEWRADYYYNNTFSTQQNSSYTYNYDGTYWVNLTVTNASGCISNISKPISIYKPNASIYLMSSSSSRGNYDCDSLTIKVGTYSNQPIESYFWNFGDGTTSTEPTPEHSYKSVGVYNIQLNYTTESGCKGVASYAVTVWNKPKADFTYFIPCGNSLNLQFSGPSAFSDNWRWEFGDNSFQGYGNNTSHSYSDTGKYSVTFINHIGHCSDTITKQVYANVLPSSVLITKAENTCEGNRGTVSFDQRSLRISGGTWNFGDGTIIPYDTSVHVIKHTYSQTGRYQVTLTGIGNCTLTDSRSVVVLLKQSPVLTANKTEICSNDNLNVQIAVPQVNPFTGNMEWGQYYVTKFEYNNGGSFNGYYNSYDWKYTNYSSTLQNFTAGTTKMRAIISAGYNGCTDTTNYINLKVNGPIAGFKIINTSGCYKTPIVFEDTSKTVTNTPLATWRWDFGDGISETYTSSNKVEHLYRNPGIYNVQLTVTDASGCRSSFNYSVSARGPKASFATSGLFVPNVPLNTTVTFYNNTISWYSNQVNYSWQYGDGATATDYQGTHTYTQPGTNTVKLIATDPSIQCSDTAVQVITVKDFNAAFTFSTNFITNSTCPPVLVRINNVSVGYNKLVWDFGDGTIINDQVNPSHTYYDPGVYRITLYTYGYNGLTGTYKDSVTVTQPSAQIEADVLKGCTSQQVTLNATTTNASSYTWDFGDGTIRSGTTVSSIHKYLTPGVYEPKLIVKDVKGCASAAALPDKIIIDSLYLAIKGIPTQICDSTRIFFTPDVKSIAADQVQQPLIYHWDFGTGNPADTSNSKNAVFNFNKTGTYTVKFKVLSPYGCIKEVSEQVVVHKKAKGTITGPLALCSGASATFSASASSSPVAWEWIFNNGNVAAIQNPVPQVYTSPGTYNVQLVVKYNGCYDTTVSKLIVHPNPVVSLSASKNLLCRGETAQLNASGGVSYSWKPATSLSNPSIASPLASPAQNAKYTVEVTNNLGCTKSDSIELTVVQPSKITMANDTFVCRGSGIQLKAQGTTLYQWINNVAGLNNTQVGNPIASPTSDITYTVVGSDSYNCFKDTASIKVIVQPLPSVIAESDVQMLAAETHQLIATASADVIEWLWSPDNYLSCTRCPSPLARPRTPIDYVVTVRNRYKCAASDTIRVKLECSEEFVFIPNSFTPNNDGKNDVFYIKGKGIGVIKSLVIYNRWGETIFERKNFDIDDRASSWDGKYKGLLVPAGSYVFFAEMQCDSGQPIIKKGTVTVIY